MILLVKMLVSLLYVKSTTGALNQLLGRKPLKKVAPAYASGKIR
jgi:hypothetical protein